VGIVSRRKDWELILAEHWYRIPVKSAPDCLKKMKYLAFYQTRAFGDEKWAVNCYARITGITTAKRRKLLPDEPNHKRADESYYRIAISKLQRLPRPVPSRRWRRIVFIPTTLEKLLRAREIKDLYQGVRVRDTCHVTRSASSRRKPQ